VIVKEGLSLFSCFFIYVNWNGLGANRYEKTEMLYLFRRTLKESDTRFCGEKNLKSKFLF